MRQKTTPTKVKIEYIRYILIDREQQTAETHHYKTTLAEKIGISTRTLDRNMPYESEKWLIYPIKKVNL